MWQRQACGLLPVRYHAELEKGMRLHADYLIQNKKMGHGETEVRPGFTKEGLSAGMTCVMGYDKSSHQAGINEQLQTLFHRSSCLAPDLSGSAMVLHRGVFLISTTRFVRSRLRGKVLVYPPHGMKAVPRSFSAGGEIPMPIDRRPARNRLGTCVGVFAMGLYWSKDLPEAPKLKLVALGPRGRTRSVLGKVFYPGHVPPVSGLEKNYRGNVAFVPTRPLKPRTTYRAVVTVSVGPPSRRARDRTHKTFSYEWEFTTGGGRRR